MEHIPTRKLNNYDYSNIDEIIHFLKTDEYPKEINTIAKRKRYGEKFKNDFIVRKNKLFYCSYGRLNKSVMLTDGSLAICCNDYSIEHNVGSLIDNDLKELYKHKKLFSDDEYIRGKKALCNKCEFYSYV